MSRFRTVLFWTHLCLGLVGGVVIFIMCITGAALSFEKNILEYVESSQRQIPAAGERRGVEELIAAAMAAKPEARPGSILLSSDPTVAATVSLGREGQVFVDPYTAAVTGSGHAGTRKFLGFMTDLHRWLALSGDGRAWGKAVTGACNLMFLGLAFTGIYIWFPRRWSWQHFRPNLWFRRTSGGKARDFNWHNTIGFWTSLFLIVITITAAVISYQWAGNLIYTLTGNEVPPAQQGGQGGGAQPFVIAENIDELWTATEARVPDRRTISLRLPVAKEAVFTIDEGTSLNKFGRSTLTLDAATGAFSKWEPYSQQNSARQLRSWFRFTHTGESFGIIGQIIGFIACLGGCVLVYTGTALALRRVSAFIRRRREPQTAS